MITRSKHNRASSRVPCILAGWAPLSELWESANAPYPSSESARWDLRQLRPALVAADALAFHRGRLLIHPQRFAEVKERAAIDAARRRAREAA